MDYQGFLVRDPAICGGELTVKGTRLTVRTVLASLAEGAAEDDILADFPSLTRDALRAVIAFAAASGQYLPWSFDGYGKAISLPATTVVRVLTPQSIVAASKDGFTPRTHASAIA